MVRTSVVIDGNSALTSPSMASSLVECSRLVCLELREQWLAEAVEALKRLLRLDPHNPVRLPDDANFILT